MCDDNIVYFREKPENVEKKLKKVFKVKEQQTENLDIILSQCIIQNNFHLFYEYLYSEIEFNGGILKFSESIKINPVKVRKFLYSEKEPNLVFLAKVLKGLGFRLSICKDTFE